ncbi:MAG: bifunctional adenosylcobinamide kinase/adenosylcobinamide-phosphate guanylyltransferase [Lachnospiraceae bacterium]|nr:bifunctional adenosylcobinamide kinase/adenosylcobinamide-phosphate guanylyltransferase [Lachnospiraceae bacterium]
MKLIIGGTAQGKLVYVLQKYGLQENMVWDGSLPNEINDIERKRNPIIINHLHQWIKNCMISGGCPEDEIMSFLDCNEDCILICDEVGNGIVPIDPFEREYRERVGRILVQLAKRADEVERIICGIGQKIK